LPKFLQLLCRNSTNFTNKFVGVYGGRNFSGGFSAAEKFGGG